MKKYVILIIVILANLSLKSWADELIVNGDFSTPTPGPATPGNGGIPGWLIDSNCGQIPLINNDVIPSPTPAGPDGPRAFVGFTTLTPGVNNGRSYIYQNVYVPRDALGATLTVWYYWQSDNPFLPGTQYAYSNFGPLTLFDLRGTPVPDMNRWIKVEKYVAGMGGLTQQLRFETLCDGTSLYNNILVDGISFIVITATRTNTPTMTPTFTQTPSYTISPTCSFTPTETPTTTITPTITLTATLTPWFVPEGDVTAYPNPATGNLINFMYSLNEAADITIDVYNLAGIRAARLEDKNQPGQYNQITTWKIDQVAPGVYFYKMTTQKVSGQRKVTKIKRLVVAK